MIKFINVSYLKHILFNPKYFIDLNNKLGASCIFKISIFIFFNLSVIDIFCFYEALIIIFKIKQHNKPIT